MRVLNPNLLKKLLAKSNNGFEKKIKIITKIESKTKSKNRLPLDTEEQKKRQIINQMIEHNNAPLLP